MLLEKPSTLWCQLVRTSIVLCQPGASEHLAGFPSARTSVEVEWPGPEDIAAQMIKCLVNVALPVCIVLNAKVSINSRIAHRAQSPLSCCAHTNEDFFGDLVCGRIGCQPQCLSSRPP